MDAEQKEAEKAAGAGSGVVDIWAQLLENRDREQKEGEQGGPLREASIVFMASRGAGKSTLIHAYMFKDKEDTPKPTTSLDYKYTRSSVGMSMDKDLSHFWELGGGRKLVQLLDICVTPETLSNTLAIISVDLSRPSTVVEELQYWLQVLKARVKACTGKLSNTDIAKRAQDQQNEVFGNDHPDINKVDILPIPVLIVANKFDGFKDTESQLLRTMAHTLRIIAHSNGASLLYTSKKHKALMATFRSRISRHVLNRAPSKTVQMEHSKPLSVPGGSDTFELIGLPADASSAQSPVQAWCTAFSRYFPLNDKDKEQKVSLEELELAPEGVVDQMLIQKDEDLKQIKRKMALKRRMKQADNAAEYNK